MPAVVRGKSFIMRTIVILCAIVVVDAFRFSVLGPLTCLKRCVVLNTATLNVCKKYYRGSAEWERGDRLRLSSIPQFLEILPDNKWGLYAVIASSAASALRLERKTDIGRSLSGPVTAMLITAVLTNIGVLPSTGSIHLVSLQVFVLKLATPLLLFGADMKKIFGETGVMLKAFFLGTLGTLLGSFIAMILLSGPMSSIGISGDSWKIASALTAKNIGGGLNFFAVADAIMVSKTTIAAGLAVDNLLGLLYFPLISWIGAPYDENTKSADHGHSTSNATKMTASGTDATLHFSDMNAKETAANTAASAIDKFSPYGSIEHDKRTGGIEIGGAGEGGGDERESEGVPEGEGAVVVDEVERMTSVLALGLCLVAASDHLSSITGLPSVPLSTLLTVVMASVFPSQLQGLIPSGEMIGKLLLLFFFASVGNASGTVAGTFAAKGAGSLVAFEFILYAVHLAVVLGMGRVMKIPMPDLLLASNANIGNAATASSLATAKGWKNRFLPAVLVGTLGNALGTFAGLTMGTMVLKRITGF